MALTTYTAGEVLTAASLNDNCDYAVTVPAAVPGGLTIVTPSSVTSSGGTVTQTDGKVNVAAASSVSLNGVFTSTYQNYMVLIDRLLISASYIDVNMRLRASGTDTTSSTYYSGSIFGTYDGTVGGGAGNGVAFFNLGSALTTAQQQRTLQVFSPQTATITTYTNVGVSRDAMFNSGGYQSGSTSFDGLTIYSASGNYSGNITVYGYQKS